MGVYLSTTSATEPVAIAAADVPAFHAALDAALPDWDEPNPALRLGKLGFHTFGVGSMLHVYPGTVRLPVLTGVLPLLARFAGAPALIEMRDESATTYRWQVDGAGGLADLGWRAPAW